VKCPCLSGIRAGNCSCNRLPLYGLLQPFYEAGEYWVWLFWCISGYIFFWKYRDAIHDRSTGGWIFFLLRLSRLYLLHLVTLALVALARIRNLRRTGPVLRCDIFCELRRGDFARVVSHLPLFRSAGSRFRSRPHAALAGRRTVDARVDAGPSDIAARGGLTRC
jgi:peptidoglycan/LPS O-acetylase OafA/YrhL